MKSSIRRTILRLLAFSLAVVGVFALVGGALGALSCALFVAQPLPAGNHDVLSIRLFGLTLLDYAWPAGTTAASMVATCLLAAAKLAGLGLAAGLAAQLFLAVLDGRTPFTRAIARQIRWISLGLLVYMLAFSWTSGLGGVLFALVVPAIVFSLADIFDYGCALQQQADETL